MTRYPRAMFAPLLIAIALLATPAEARDANQVWKFRKHNPCPATGHVYGRCHGWQVDHVVPLKCGGADRPANMQWLTIQAHKAKTKREAKMCRKARAVDNSARPGL